MDVVASLFTEGSENSKCWSLYGANLQLLIWVDIGRPPEIGTNLIVLFGFTKMQTYGPLKGFASFLLRPCLSEVDTNTFEPTGNFRKCTSLSNCSLEHACIRLA